MPIPPALRSRKRALVVDYEQDVVDYIVRVLKELPGNLEVTTAYDGYQALLLVERLKPDLVILDIFIPGTDGVAVCQAIKSDPLLKDVRVLGITGYPSPENLDRMLASGADEMLVKPLLVEELQRVVTKLLYGRGKVTRANR